MEEMERTNKMVRNGSNANRNCYTIERETNRACFRAIKRENYDKERVREVTVGVDDYDDDDDFCRRKIEENSRD